MNHTFHSAKPLGRRPYYSLLALFAVACFLGTLATDIAYWRTANVMWVDFSDWLVTVGVILGYVTIVAALIEIFAFSSTHLRRPAWPYAIGLIVALVLGTFDMLVHTRDAWTSVVPWGIALSAAVVIIALLSGSITRGVTRESYEPRSSKGIA